MQFSVAKFKQLNSLEERKADVQKKISRYPDYVPIVIELYEKSIKIEGLVLEKNK